MIIEKRKSHKMQALSDTILSETNTYKYLGTIINRQLKDTNHIGTHLSEKLKKTESYVRYTRSHHLDIKQITFGNILWEKVVLPSYPVTCWFSEMTTSRKQLLSFKYNCTKAVLRLRSMPFRSATIADLECIPIIWSASPLQTILTLFVHHTFYT